jgi:hypothetical protein
MQSAFNRKSALRRRENRLGRTIVAIEGFVRQQLVERAIPLLELAHLDPHPRRPAGTGAPNHRATPQQNGGHSRSQNKSVSSAGARPCSLPGAVNRLATSARADRSTSLHRNGCVSPCSRCAPTRSGWAVSSTSRVRAAAAVRIRGLRPHARQPQRVLRARGSTRGATGNDGVDHGRRRAAALRRR